MAQVPVRSDRLEIFRHSQRKTIMAERSHESVALMIDCALLRWVCFDCRFPLCKRCQESEDPVVRGKRPLHAVKHNAFIGDDYYCLKCRYPPCRGCGKEAPSTKYRLKEWWCKECLRQGKSNDGGCKAFQGLPTTLP